MGNERHELLFDRPIAIGVFGIIGVGKTTLSRGLGRSLNFEHVEEKFPENPFLAKFYEDPGRWSLQSQMWFLWQKVDQLKVLDPTKNYIIDPDLEMDRLYAKTLVRIGLMEKRDLAIYEDLFHSLIEKRGLRRPDLYIRVAARMPVVKRRITERGRSYEMQMLTEEPFRNYLVSLDENIDEFMSTQTNKKMLYINANKNGFVNKKMLSELRLEIKSVLDD